MDKYLRYGLTLFAAWIIATRIISLIYVTLREYPDLIAYLNYYVAISVLVGLLAVVAGIAINVELKGLGWDIKKIAMTFLGIVLILVGAYNVLFHALFNIFIPGTPLAADSQAVIGWILNAFRALTVIAALLIIVSLREEESVARMGLFLYSIVAIAGVAFNYFGMEGNAGIGVTLALLGIAAGVLILKRV